MRLLRLVLGLGVIAIVCLLASKLYASPQRVKVSVSPKPDAVLMDCGVRCKNIRCFRIELTQGDVVYEFEAPQGIWCSTNSAADGTTLYQTEEYNTYYYYFEGSWYCPYDLSPNHGIAGTGTEYGPLSNPKTVCQ